MMSVENLKVLIRGGGDLASGVAHRLNRCHFKVCITEIPHPFAVRRAVSFCEAVYENEKTVEGVTARLVFSQYEVVSTWYDGKIPIIVDQDNRVKDVLKPDVLIDAIIAKKNLGTRITDARLVIGLGVGFNAGKDVHVIIETNRGHNLGRVITSGEAEADTGIPADIGGFSTERVLRAPAAGRFITSKQIGDYAGAGETVALVDGIQVKSQISGVIRGLLRNGTEVYQGMKVGDIDPRGIKEYCYTISDKARMVAGGALEAILASFNHI